MHYLIDGHNLIAQMSDISLDDPDDEAQLILRLRSWIAGDQRRRATVYFDGGLPGGRSPTLSGVRLNVHFASSGQDADTLLIRHIRKVKNPPEFTLVSSDGAIVAVAEKRRVPVIRADEFAGQLDLKSEPEVKSEPPAKPDEPLLSEEEVAEWLELFGPEPSAGYGRDASARKPRSRPAPKKKPASPARKEPPKPARPADELKETGAALTEDEVSAWLELFGDEEEAQSASDAEADASESRKKPRRKRPRSGEFNRSADQLKESDAELTDDEVDEWLDIFRGDDA